MEVTEDHIAIDCILTSLDPVLNSPEPTFTATEPAPAQSFVPEPITIDDRGHPKCIRKPTKLMDGTFVTQLSSMAGHRAHPQEKPESKTK